MGDKGNTFAARAALPILLVFSILRALISLYPSLDLYLDYGTIHVQMLHVTSVAVWFSLSLTCIILLRTIVTSTRLQFDASVFTLGVRSALVTVVAIPYVVWIISFIYQQWVSSFTIFFQLIYAIPSITFFVHTIYQAYFVFSAWKCLGKSRPAPILLSWQATWTNILYNSVMIAHMASVAVFTIKDKGIYQLPMWFIANELYYRLMAICVFYRIYYTCNWFDSIESKDDQVQNGMLFRSSLVTLSPPTHTDDQPRDGMHHLHSMGYDCCRLYQIPAHTPIHQVNHCDVQSESIVVSPIPLLPHDQSENEFYYSTGIPETTPQPEIIEHREQQCII